MGQESLVGHRGGRLAERDDRDADAAREGAAVQTEGFTAMMPDRERQRAKQATTLHWCLAGLTLLLLSPWLLTMKSKESKGKK